MRARTPYIVTLFSLYLTQEIPVLQVKIYLVIKPIMRGVCWQVRVRKSHANDFIDVQGHPQLELVRLMSTGDNICVLMV